jgi:hypothetical protein
MSRLDHLLSANAAARLPGSSWGEVRTIRLSVVRIEVQSAQGQGATFTFRLPLKAEEGTHAFR